MTVIKIKTGIVGKSICLSCKKIISVTEQFETDKGYVYTKKSMPCRYISRQGKETNFCKECMK